ncbi:MAG TPA: hypothetical protein ENN07_05235 [candidate division Zixibacteria bacterium]|nr:hypothetical protein [candidate division Zixibacteria bacterium]
MSPTAYAAVAGLGALYLLAWPFRILLWSKREQPVSAGALFLPALGGAIIIVFDLFALRLILPEWYLFAVFVHFFLLLFGFVAAVRYYKSTNLKEEDYS